jgi:mono/diheme cytochrome c family protein
MKPMTMKPLQHLAACAALGLSLTAAAQAAPAAAAAPASAAQTLQQRGEYLARAGDCMACHSVAGKPAYSGGLAIDSGHGIIYSSNITPDKQHGIGNYTEAQFADAMRKGVRADGTHLYPAMPYPSYAKVSDADVKALYAYFMNDVKPAAASAPESTLSFPFNLRWGMAIWNWFFASDKPFAAPAGASAQVARGAYLVEGLEHCGSCHTPRGLAMNEKAGTSGEAKFLAGGELNGWATPSLRGLPRWSEQDIVDYLQTGRNTMASVAGDMTEVVVHSTSTLADDDVHAIAAYLRTLPPAPTRGASVTPQGAAATTRKLTAAQNLTPPGHRQGRAPHLPAARWRERRQRRQPAGAGAPDPRRRPHAVHGQGALGAGHAGLRAPPQRRRGRDPGHLRAPGLGQPGRRGVGARRRGGASQGRRAALRRREPKERPSRRGARRGHQSIRNTATVCVSR